MTPVTFDRPTRGDDDVVAMRVRARRERLTRIVIGVVLASCAILVAAIVQIGTAGGEEEAAAARATATKLREAPLLGAIAPNAGSTLTSRTQTALRVEKRRETIRQGKVARARSAW